MKKPVCFYLIIFILSSVCFAKTSAEGVEAWDKEFSSVEEAKESFKKDFSEYQGITDEDCSNLVKNFSYLEETIDVIRKCSVKDLSETTALLNQNGISGNNSVMKVQAIISGIEYFKLKSQITAKEMPVIALMKMFGLDPVAMNTKDIVDENDFKVIKKNKKLLMKVM